jgi:hypothetical protein
MAEEEKIQQVTETEPAYLQMTAERTRRKPSESELAPAEHPRPTFTRLTEGLIARRPVALEQAMHGG